ncbi:hypothetical protein SAMN05661008_01436 [Alkalithermobacter thermoalcaliphilus JW-YL-7 = DSM 7308]|uniref:NHL repeat containing protein n=1 Tax=Alkalithermobacter thermoalcaliphilus JW-YL-7 = DSM 7308 TaxID=1121328 RepID=A0A150FT42_CLOPD|nr:hypothetical protein JWYL7_1823 [[Clostridium] paradoxum JW-YL-7 = DSM 7308]SHL08981.1 hypothetical protein SAMN05661008_01436 [[Clostridium] paradoxum JW-YL-7 = DSM 7308]
MKKKNIVIILAIMLIIFANPKTINFFKNINSDNSKVELVKEIPFSYKSNMTFKKLSNEFIMYDGNTLICIDNKGEKIFTSNIRANNYSLDTNESQTYILDKTNKNVYIVDKKGSIINKFDIDADAVYIKSFKNGNFIIHYETDIQLEGVKLLSSKGELIKDISIPKSTINFVDIDDNTQGFLISAITIENDSLYNNIFLYNRKGELVSADKYENRLFIRSYINPKEIFLFEPDSIQIKEKNLEPITTVNFKDTIRYIGKIDNKVGIVNERGNVVYISEKGEEKIQRYPIDNIKGFEYTQAGNVVYSDRSMYFEASKKRDDFTKDIINVLSLENNYIVVVFRGSIKIFRVK